MNIIGIHDGHNATVALFQNGRITYALSEERLSRKKNQGGFPILALECILNEVKLTPQDIDKVVFVTDKTHALEWHDQKLLLKRYEAIMKINDQPQTARTFFQDLARRVAKRFHKITEPSAQQGRFQPLIGKGFSVGQITTIDHHLAHAASAYFSQGDFSNDVLCLTNDGGGDGSCAAVYIGKNGKIERIVSVPVRNSFVALYARATFLMGMTPLEHEYKLMGLAPYAYQEKAQKLAEKLLICFEWPLDNPYEI